MMNRCSRRLGMGFVCCLALFAAAAHAADWPMWGRTPQRNMAAEKGGGVTLPLDIKAGRMKADSEDIDLATTQRVKWVAKLGSQSYGNPTIAAGRVLVGTNNGSPRDPRFKGDYSLVYCFDEQTGKLLWQFTVPKLGAGKVSDWEYLGICSSPTVDGNRVYLVTNRCEVVCLDLEGMANGNDGPFKDEGQYMAGPGKPALEATATDADILWRYDMREELGVFPHNVTSSSVLILGDHVYATTSNGVDWSHTNIPNPRAPVLICLDKYSGELRGEEMSGISERLLHCNWSTPTLGQQNGSDIVIFGAGDGFTYGFDPTPLKNEEGDGVLKELWRFDCNRPALRVRDGEPIKYATTDGPSEIIGTPVFRAGKVYVAIGQDPEHGEGRGQFNCFKVPEGDGGGDITGTALAWMQPIDRSMSTPSISDDGLVFIADYTGYIHCFDAHTGKELWQHNTMAHIWGSTLLVDGKVVIGNEDGYLTILAAGREKQVLAEIPFDASIYSSPVIAGGVLYVATQTHLYAIEAGSGAGK